LSAIYGLLWHDGREVETAALDAMADAMRYWGPDGGGSWRGGPAGMGQLVLHTTPEARLETGPIYGPQVLVAAARLDNREELLAALGLGASTAESSIVAAAWAKWGEDSPSRLHGDWAFATWDPRSRRLFLARDPFGATALYYHAGSSLFAFGSSRKALLALPQVPRRLDELQLARQLVFCFEDGTATMREGIRRLPPGHSLSVQNGTLRVRRYYRMEEAPEVRLSSDEEYVERFLELYASAVRRRLRSVRQVAITLSSGLDSGSVTALAARALEGTGKTLIALTAVPLFGEAAAGLPRIVVDEWPLASAVARRWEGLDHRAVDAAAITPLAAFERSLELHDEPEFAATNAHWILAVLEESRRAGADALLTGQLGNYGVSWMGDPHTVWRPFAHGHWLRAWRVLRQRRRAERVSLARATWRHLVRPLRAAARGYAFARGFSSRPMRQFRTINPRFAERLGLAANLRQSGFELVPWRPVSVRQQRMSFLLPASYLAGAIWHEKGAGYGLDVRDPTADVPLFEFCLGTPADQFARDGHDRWLLRRAMEGLLPPAVQWNTRRGIQGADVTWRLRADAANVTAAVAEVTASPAAREYLDVELLRARWVTLQGQIDYMEAVTFARSLLYGLYLSRAGES
jgi:asparagine synthase (glutamine-hydrolysing)